VSGRDWLKRLGMLGLTLWGVSLIAFFLIRWVPGDPVMLMIGERGASPEAIAELRARLGLDASLPVQYLRFATQALRGDLGVSILSGRPVMQEFRERFAATAELGGLAMILAVLVGVPLGVSAAIWRGRWWDRVATSMSVALYSLPIFWWGLVAIALVSVRWALLPVSGRIGVEFDVPMWSGLLFIDVWRAEEGGWPAFVSALRHAMLPALVLATVPLAVITRMTRSSFLDVLNEEYVRAARAKGLSRPRVLFVHALRNALVPVVTVIGLMLGTILTGAILTESIFSWPGLGRWLVSAVISRDYPVIQGGVLLVAVVVLVTSLSVDALNVWLSPRLRTRGRS